MRGQYFSFDAIIAAVIFVLALVALLSYWHSVKSYLDFQNDQISTDAVRVSNLLFTPPSPSSDCSSMTRLGFALDWSDRRINSSIVSCAHLWNQDTLRSELGTPYGVDIAITNLANNSVTEIGSLSTATNVVKIRRLATVLDSQTNKTYLAAVDLTLYK